MWLSTLVLLLAASASASPAHAEMTEADRAGQRAFVACLDKTGGDEDSCIETLGRYAWYPRDNATCEIIATRVAKILTVGGDPIWSDMFRNERCARLGLFFSEQALPDKATGGSAPLTVDCREARPVSHCREMHGRHLWNPAGDASLCESVADLQERYLPSGLSDQWGDWFRNERCHRLGDSYFDATAGIVREASVGIRQ